MTDIVQRLSDLSDGYEEVEEFELAIAEINMLRKELGECRVAFESGNKAVAENIRLIKEIERMKLDLHSCHPGCTKAGCVNDRLRADERRLDWLSDKNNVIGNVQLPTTCVLNNPDSLRSAIDAAMRL
jgi:hypothetical protein